MRRTLVAVTAVAAAVAVAAIAVVLLTAGSGRPSGPGPAWPNNSNPSEGASPATLRLGFVVGIPQAPALVGLQEGLFANELRGTGVVLRPVPFRTDAAEATALASGQLDAAYASASSILADVGNPEGTKITIVSGATRGKATLVNLVSTRAFLAAHSADVEDLIRAQIQVNELLNHNLLESSAAYATELTALTGQRLTASSIGESLARTSFTDDPSAATLNASVPTSLTPVVRPALPTLYDVAPLDLFLRMAGERPVTT